MPTRTCEEVPLVDIGDHPYRREIDNREESGRRIDVEPWIRRALRHDTVNRRGHRCDGAKVLPEPQTRDRRRGQAEQLETGFSALDRRQLGGVLGVQPFEFLAARCANLDELLGAHELAFVRIEFGSGGDVPRLHFSKFRAEDFRQRLTAPDTLAQFDQHARHAAADQRRDDDLLVRVRLDDTRQPELRGSASRDTGVTTIPAR